MIANQLTVKVKSVNNLQYNERKNVYHLLKHHYPLLSEGEAFQTDLVNDNLYIYLIESGEKIVATRQVYFCPFRKMGPDWAIDIEIGRAHV